MKKHLLQIFLSALMVCKGYSQIIPDAQLNKIFIGQYKDDCISVLGPSKDTCFLISDRVMYELDSGDSLEGVMYLKSKKNEAITANRLNCYCNERIGIRVRFENSKVSSIEYFGRNFQTTKGIRIGDKKGKVLREYGDNYKMFRYIRDEYPYYSYGYFYPDYGLEFYFDYRRKNKIIQINYVGMPANSLKLNTD